MNPTAILALISDLYEQIARLTQENEALKAADGPAPTDISKHVSKQG